MPRAQRRRTRITTLSAHKFSGRITTSTTTTAPSTLSVSKRSSKQTTQLEADNEAYAQRREFRATFKRALANGDRDELIEARRAISDKLTLAQHQAAHSDNPSSHEDDIRRYAKFMTQLDACERALGLPASCPVLLDHPPPIRTPGFRGYYAGTRSVSAEFIQRYPHLTTKQAVALADAESTVDALKSLHVAGGGVKRTARRTLDADLANAAPRSAPPSPPESTETSCLPSSPPTAVAPRGNDGGPLAARQRGLLVALSLVLNVAAALFAIVVGMRLSSEPGANDALA
eukprot:6184531-Pleurochrysis_carterae.AAC.1